jgi:hypothetical protein
MKKLFFLLCLGMFSAVLRAQTDVTVTNDSGVDIHVELRVSNSACENWLETTEDIANGDSDIVTAPGGTAPYLIHVYEDGNFSNNNYQTCSGTTCTALSGGPGSFTITWTGCNSVLIE